MENTIKNNLKIDQLPDLVVHEFRLELLKLEELNKLSEENNKVDSQNNKTTSVSVEEHVKEGKNQNTKYEEYEKIITWLQKIEKEDRESRDKYKIEILKLENNIQVLKKKLEIYENNAKLNIIGNLNVDLQINLINYEIKEKELSERKDIEYCESEKILFTNDLVKQKDFKEKLTRRRSWLDNKYLEENTKKQKLYDGSNI